MTIRNMSGLTISTLFRGDKRGNNGLNNSNAYGYSAVGLLSKLINNGDPAYVSKAGLIEAIRVHIASQSAADGVLYSQSSFLSFSSCRNRARVFATGKGNDPADLIPGDAGVGDKQRYLFTLDISGCTPTTRNGIYLLAYHCNLTSCEYCSPQKREHHLMLIDVVIYLSENNSFAKTQTALENARRDLEWLVLPIDYLPSLNGLSARIPPSDIWCGEDCYFL